MRTIIYFEALGATKKTLLRMLNERLKVKKEMNRWAAKHGGDPKVIGIRDDAFGFTWSIVCKEGTEPHDWANWKRLKDSKIFWNPRHSTKIGKQLDAEMKALAAKIPGISQVMELLGVPRISGLHVNSIGLEVKKGRLLLQIPDAKYKPPKGVNLKRISDLQFQKLTGRKQLGGDDE